MIEWWGWLIVFGPAVLFFLLSIGLYALIAMWEDNDPDYHIKRRGRPL